MICAGLSAGAADAASPAQQARLHENWRQTVVHLATPGLGCFRATYPATMWRQRACKPGQGHPIGWHAVPPALAGRSTSGNTILDWSATTVTPITSAVGTFPNVSGVTGEASPWGANTYSLQLNSGFFTPPICNGQANCFAQQQFVYDTNGTGFIQYWVANAYTTCPSGWVSTPPWCWTNNHSTFEIPTIPVTSLGEVKLAASVTAGGTDTLVVTYGAEAYATSGEDSVFTLAGAWKFAEFNVFGPGDSTEASFNKGAHLRVKLVLKDGAKTAPGCVNTSTTAETTNLTIDQTCTAKGGPSPFITFREHS
jgi:hypothetical protein